MPLFAALQYLWVESQCLKLSLLDEVVLLHIKKQLLTFYPWRFRLLMGRLERADDELLRLFNLLNKSFQHVVFLWLLALLVDLLLVMS